MSPEKALSQTSSDYLWSQPEFRAQVNLVAVDEVHLVHDGKPVHYYYYSNNYLR
jgi:hypothetical protein